MKLSETINDAICIQISNEYSNMLKYKQIESYFEDLRLRNIAKKFHNQAEEENGHAARFISYLNQRLGGKYNAVQIPHVVLSFDSPTSAANAFLEAELQTSKHIEEIADLIYEEKSYMDIKFINWFLEQQVIEEEEADEFLKQIMMCKDFVLFDAAMGD